MKFPPCWSAKRARATCRPSASGFPIRSSAGHQRPPLRASRREPKRRKESPLWCSAPQTCFDDLVRGVPLVLVMAGIQDPGNVGALLRTAEAFGAYRRRVLPGLGNRHRRSLRPESACGPRQARLCVCPSCAAWELRYCWRNSASPACASMPRRRTRRPRRSRCWRRTTASRESARKPLLPWEVNWREPAALSGRQRRRGTCPPIWCARATPSCAFRKPQPARAAPRWIRSTPPLPARSCSMKRRGNAGSAEAAWLLGSIEGNEHRESFRQTRAGRIGRRVEPARRAHASRARSRSLSASRIYSAPANPCAWPSSAMN